MFRQILFLFTVSTVALVFVSGASVEGVPEEYKDCDGCWVASINQFIPNGQVYPSPTSCQGYRCLGSQAVIEECGTVAVVPPAYIVSDDSQSYPDCCPRIVDPRQES